MSPRKAGQGCSGFAHRNLLLVIGCACVWGTGEAALLFLSDCTCVAVHACGCVEPEGLQCVPHQSRGGHSLTSISGYAKGMVGLLGIQSCSLGRVCFLGPFCSRGCVFGGALGTPALPESAATQLAAVLARPRDRGLFPLWSKPPASVCTCGL